MRIFLTRVKNSPCGEVAEEPLFLFLVKKEQEEPRRTPRKSLNIR